MLENRSDSSHSKEGVLTAKYFDTIKAIGLPPFFGARLNAKLQSCAEPGWKEFFEFIIPAGAFTATTFAVWGWLLISDIKTSIDDIILNSSEYSWVAENNHEPLTFLNITEGES